MMGRRRKTLIRLVGAARTERTNDSALPRTLLSPLRLKPSRTLTHIPSVTVVTTITLLVSVRNAENVRGLDMWKGIAEQV